MALDKLVDSTQLDADLTSVANAIRTKGGTSASLAFPAGFVSAVEAIETGGGGNTIQGSFIGDGTSYSPYIDYSGTPTIAVFFADEQLFINDVSLTGVKRGVMISGVFNLMSYDGNATNNINTIGADYSGDYGFNSPKAYTPNLEYDSSKARFTTELTPIARGCFANGIEYRYLISDVWP